MGIEGTATAVALDTPTALSTFAQAASAMALDGLAAGLDSATVALGAAEGATALFRAATEAVAIAQAAADGAAAACACGEQHRQAESERRQWRAAATCPTYLPGASKPSTADAGTDAPEFVRPPTHRPDQPPQAVMTDAMVVTLTGVSCAPNGRGRDTRAA